MNCQPKQPNNAPGKGEILQIYHTFEVFGPRKKCTIYPKYAPCMEYMDPYLQIFTIDLGEIM